MNAQPPHKNDFSQLLTQKIDALRPKLLDLSARNPLISLSMHARAASYVRVVDANPSEIYQSVTGDLTCEFKALPPLEGDPTDETTEAFLDALSVALISDDEYLSAIEGLDTEASDYEDSARQLLRNLKDRVRANLGMPPRIVKRDESLKQHALNNNINPSYDLSFSEIEPASDRSPKPLQIMMLPLDLERRLNGIISKCKVYQQETGINVCRTAFGFLEWRDPARSDDRTYFSPILLHPAQLTRQNSPNGPIFKVEGTDDEIELNLPLRQKLKDEFNIELPDYDGGNLEEYFTSIAEIKTRLPMWRVRTWIVCGAFPASRIAMFEDLDTQVTDFSQNKTVEQLLIGSDSADYGGLTNEYDIDSPEIEREVPFLVKRADASQFGVLVDVVKSKNIAVEGPPGTGKSDTIVNAIAAALYKGQKILFVAEKAAALNVVHSRLKEVGLGEFVLPLLAGKQSKEELVSSLRERLAVIEKSPRDLEVTQQQYATIRERLSKYVNILSSEWATTKKTVHAVLGESIASTQYLDKLTPAQRSAHSVPARDFTQFDIDDIKSLINQLLEACRHPDYSSDYWSETSTSDDSPFNIDAIMSQAEITAASYREANISLQSLVDFLPGFDRNSVQLSLLETLSHCLGNLIEFGYDEQFKSVTDLESPVALCDLLDEQSSLQTTYSKLNQRVVAPGDKSSSEALKNLLHICSSFELSDIDEDKFSEKIDALTRTTSALKAKLPELVELTQSQPDILSSSIRDILHVRKMWGLLPAKIASLRSQQVSDPNATLLLLELVNRGVELQRERHELLQKIEMPNDVTSQSLTAAAEVISKSGALSFFSGAFRDAKNRYTSISKASSFDKHAASTELLHLAKFYHDREQFIVRAANCGIFGVHFNGLDTDFDAFKALAEFYEIVDETFVGISRRALRNLLKYGEKDILDSIPDIQIDADDVRLSEINEWLSKNTERLTSMQLAFDGIRELLQTLTPASRQIPLPVLRLTINELDAYHRANDEWIANPLHEKFHSFFSDSSKSYEAKKLAIQSAHELFALPNTGNDIREYLRTSPPNPLLDAVRTAERLLSTAKSELEVLETRSCCKFRLAAEDKALCEAEAYLNACSTKRGSLEVAISIQKIREQLRRYDLLETLDKLSDQIGNDSLLPELLIALIHKSVAQRVYLNYGSDLAYYSGSQLDTLQKQFIDADDKLRVIGRKQLRAQLLQDARPPSGNSRGRVSDYTEMGLITHVVEQKRSRTPLREIIRNSKNALLELKPCWIMSPLSVAQYIPKGSLEFDLCIIDEASQMPPEDAIGSIYRAQRSMIVGDTKQLPPTNFFSKSFTDEDEEEQDDVVTQESILELANSAFRPKKMLKWHYRSRHSALIKFSNQTMYDDELVVFPSPNEADPTMGVYFRQTHGIYKKGLNTIEGEAVVEAALQFIRNNPDRSLGVVAMNKVQAEFINERLQFAIARDQKASKYIENWQSKRGGLEELFVKNLENVQGDERDVIFISTVYGPAAKGERVRQAFGPINGIAGKRRLNVLFTRAREQIFTFSSMNSSDILAESGGNQGALMLKQWLEYSAGGTLPNKGGVLEAYDSPFEKFVADQINAMGCTAISQIGVQGYSIDIGVQHPDWPYGYLLGVECDGATYHSAKSARDRDRHRQEVLENLGWQIHRIWSTDWFANPGREAERLRDVIQARLHHLKTGSRIAISEKHPVYAPAPVPAQSPPVTSQVEMELDSTQSKANKEAEPKVDPKKNVTAKVTLGKKVRLRYLDKGCETYLFTIVNEPSDPNRGKINKSAPLATSVLDATVGEEVEIILGSLVRRAIIEDIS